MATHRYVALLRGINVGGKNPVPMAELRSAVSDAGFEDVATYIQSGNVLFSSDRPRSELEGAIEAAVEQSFGVPIMVVVRSARQLGSIVSDAPPGFGARPDDYYSDAVFLKSPLTPAAAMKVVQLREGVDQAWPGKGVIYFARLGERRTQSKLSKIMGTPEYRSMTIRSWATTTKLLDLIRS